MLSLELSRRPSRSDRCLLETAWTCRCGGVFVWKPNLAQKMLRLVTNVLATIMRRRPSMEQEASSTSTNTTRAFTIGQTPTASAKLNFLNLTYLSPWPMTRSPDESRKTGLETAHRGDLRKQDELPPIALLSCELNPRQRYARAHHLCL